MNNAKTYFEDGDIYNNKYLFIYHLKFSNVYFRCFKIYPSNARRVAANDLELAYLIRKNFKKINKYLRK